MKFVPVHLIHSEFDVKNHSYPEIVIDQDEYLQPRQRGKDGVIQIDSITLNRTQFVECRRYPPLLCVSHGLGGTSIGSDQGSSTIGRG